MADRILQNIRFDLARDADDKTKSGYQRYFKEEAKFYGVKTNVVEKIAVKFFAEVKPFGKQEIFDLCEELLKSDYQEEAFIAFEWTYRLRNEYQESDFETFEKWLATYVNNWAKCDTLCNHTIGAFVEMYPLFIQKLKQWTRSENRWLRRGAAVTLIVPAKHGKFTRDILEIADDLIEDKDDMVQKGYGWLLKDASIKHQREIFKYVMRNKRRMPRTALRYAIERMPEDLKRLAMGKG